MRLFLLFLLITTDLAYAGNWNKPKKPQAPLIQYDKAEYQLDASLDEVIATALAAPADLDSFTRVELESLYRPSKEVFHVYHKLQPFRANNVVVNHHAGGIGEHTILSAHYFFAAGFNVFVTDSLTGRGLLDNGAKSFDDNHRLNSLQRVADSARAIRFVRELAKDESRINPKTIHWYGHSGNGAEGAFALSRPGVRLYYSPTDPDKLRLTSAAMMYPYCNSPRLGGNPDTPLLIVVGEHDQENPPEYCVKNFGNNKGETLAEVIVLPATHGWSAGKPDDGGNKSFLSKVVPSYCDGIRTAQGNIVMEDGRLLNIRRMPEYVNSLKDEGCINNGYWAITDWHLTRWTLERSLKHMVEAESFNHAEVKYDPMPEVATNHYRTSEWISLSEYPNAVCTNGRPAGYYTTSTPFEDSRKIALMFEGTPYTLPESGASVRLLINKYSDIWAKQQMTGRSLHGAFGDLIDAGWKIIVIPNCGVDSWAGDSVMKYSVSEFHLRGRAVVRSTLDDLTTRGILTDNTQLMVVGMASGIIALSANSDLFRAVPHKNLHVVTDGVIFPSPLDENYKAILEKVPGRSWYQSLVKGNPICGDSLAKCLPTPNVLFSITESENVFFTFQQGYQTLNLKGVDLSAKHYLKQMDNASGLLSTERWGDSPWVTTLWGWDYSLNKRGVGSVKEAFRSWLIGKQFVVIDD